MLKAASQDLALVWGHGGDFVGRYLDIMGLFVGDAMGYTMACMIGYTMGMGWGYQTKHFTVPISSLRYIVRYRPNNVILLVFGTD